MMLHGKVTDGKTQMDAWAQERPQWFSSFVFPFQQSYLNGIYTTLVTVSSVPVLFQP